MEKNTQLYEYQRKACKIDKLIERPQSETFYGDLTTKEDLYLLKPTTSKQENKIYNVYSQSGILITLNSSNRHSSPDQLSKTDQKEKLTAEHRTNLAEKQTSPSQDPHATTKAINSRKNFTQLYSRKNETLTPILVNKRREVCNEKEIITEYSIDYVRIPHDNQQQQPSHVDADDDDKLKLVHAYKVMVEAENNDRQISKQSTNDNSLQLNTENRINLQEFPKSFFLRCFDISFPKQIAFILFFIFFGTFRNRGIFGSNSGPCAHCQSFARHISVTICMPKSRASVRVYLSSTLFIPCIWSRQKTRLTFFIQKKLKKYL